MTRELLETKLFELVRNGILLRSYLTQTQIGKLLGISQVEVCYLLKNNTRNISIGRLIIFLTLLGYDVDIVVKPTSAGQPGNLTVSSQ